MPQGERTIHYWIEINAHSMIFGWLREHFNAFPRTRGCAVAFQSHTSTCRDSRACLDICAKMRHSSHAENTAKTHRIQPHTKYKSPFISTIRSGDHVYFTHWQNSESKLSDEKIHFYLNSPVKWHFSKYEHVWADLARIGAFCIIAIVPLRTNVGSESDNNNTKSTNSRIFCSNLLTLREVWFYRRIQAEVNF